MSCLLECLGFQFIGCVDCCLLVGGCSLVLLVLVWFCGAIGIAVLMVVVVGLFVRFGLVFWICLLCRFGVKRWAGLRCDLRLIIATLCLWVC